MSHIAQLTVGVPRGATLPHEKTPLSLVGQNDVPLLWSCAFVESEIHRETRRGDEDEEDESWPTFSFESTAGQLRRRFEAIAGHLDESGSEYVREVWEGCIIVAQVLASLPEDAAAVLDANEVAAMSAEGALEANLLHQMRTFAELRERWNPKLASSMTREVRRDVLTGTLPSDRKRARRAKGAESDRAGFFTLMFGTPYGKSASPAQEWLGSAPPGERLRPLEEEANVLVDALTSHRVISLSAESRVRALPYLEMAARFRTPDALQEILDVLFAQGVVQVGALAPERWREFDRVAGMNQADEVPVFDQEVLASVVAVLGD